MARSLSDYDRFIATHANQLRDADVPEIYWQTLFTKLKDRDLLFEADKFHDKELIFEMQIDPDAPLTTVTGGWRARCVSPLRIKPGDPKHIYLIDHIWNCEIDYIREALETDADLVNWAADLMAIRVEELTMEKQIHKILEYMWCFIQPSTYENPARGSEATKPKWYIMDWFGSRIQHSDTPNLRVAPIFYAEDSRSYSIMWPIMEVKNGDEITRDFLYGECDPSKRRARLIPWTQHNFMRINYAQVEPDVFHFQSCRPDETWPSADFEFEGLPKDRNLKVYIENQNLREHLTDERFHVVDDPLEADILWYCSHFDDFKTFSETRPKCMINQFPCENVLTSKHLFPVTARRAASKADPYEIELSLGSNPKWLPVTYDLTTEMLKFVSFFQNRSRRMLDNHWICKPWNSPRERDTHITGNIDRIIRVPEAGPKIVCKYVENPVLFFYKAIGSKVKFDLQFFVLLTSVKPVQLYVHDVFCVRLSNKPFSLKSFDDHNKHFTAKKGMHRLCCDDFISAFETQNPKNKWVIIMNDIFQCLKRLFDAAVSLPPPRGICPSPQSRAMYAIDVLLAWNKKLSGIRTIQPKILDVNFDPDCAEVCKYHPPFVNDIFSVLFMGETMGIQVAPL